MMKNYNTLNRALIKKMELLPNVFEFSTEKYGVHEYAAIYGIEKVVRRCKATQLLKSQPNFYLMRQHKRLVQYAANREVEKFNYLSEVILRKSNSYRVLSINRTLPHWWEDIRDLRRVWSQLKGISRNLSSDLKFKRVWIDKKENDFARPLGVPTPAWRCYAFEWMHHIETFMKASGYLQPWQHGGRSGVGVLSCYRQLIPKIKEANTIYEFDIKGFFDNISHEKIIKVFKDAMGEKTAQWVADILKSKPYQYKLPPLDHDLAVQEQNNLIAVTESLLDDLEELMSLPVEEGETDPADILFALLQNEGDSPEVVLTKLMEELHGFIDAEVPLEKLYELQMKGIPHPSLLDYLQLEGYSEQDRARGRDAWKNLGQEGKGVPQGLNTSPFISTFLTDVYLNRLGKLNALIMYMDDGILFADSKAQMGQYVRSLKDLLGRLGLEIAEEKSGYVKENGEWKKSLRFLGLRYLPESDQIMSDTRSGTQLLFPARNDWENVKAMAEVNNMSISNVRYKFDKLINTQAYEAGLKYGFLGCLIAGSQYKGGKTLEERQTDIRVGQGRAWARMVYAKKGFMWKTQDLYNHVETIRVDEISLTNYSSVVTHRFLDFLRKGRRIHIHKGGYRGRRQRV